MRENPELTIDKVSKLICRSRSILFITGAGISAESGLPTYRGLGGLYNGNTTEDGMTIEEALSSETMSVRPDITWKYLWQIGSRCIKAMPNSAHLVITKIQELVPETWVLTQNIDSLHRKAGNRNLIEIHGNCFELHCSECDYRTGAAFLFPDSGVMPKLPPVCPKCNGIIRPNVVLFGEMLPGDALSAYYKVIENMPEIIISIGTSGMFPYITAPVYQAVKGRQTTVEINPGTSAITSIADIHIPLSAANAMSLIWERIEKIQRSREG